MSPTNVSTVAVKSGQKEHTAAAPHRGAGIGSDGVQYLIAILVIAAMVILPAVTGSGYWIYVFQIILLYIAVSALQNMLFVDAGQFCFGQGAIFGLAAYVAGAATGLYDVPYGLAMILSVAAATMGGLLFALPALRVQGFHLGFITLSMAIILPEMVVALDQYTNGVNGVVVTLSGFFDRQILGVTYLSIMVSLLAVASIGTHVLLRQFRLGRAMRVAAASPECAQSLGINPGLMRSVAFIIAAVGTGLAGALYPPVVGFVSPDAFLLDLSILFFFAVIVGGRGEPLAAVLGVTVLYLVPNVLLAAFAEYRLLAYGFVVLFVMLFFPDGIAGSVMRWLQRRNRTQSDAGSIPIDVVISDLKGADVARAKGDVILDVKGARKSYGSVTALGDVNFDLRRGEVYGLVGANGSGKTSLLNVLSGYTKLDAGQFSINGKKVGRVPAHVLSRMGIGRTFQRPRIFPFFSTWENIEIGLDGRTTPVNESTARAIELIKASLADRTAEWLPHGQRRLVEIIRVVLKGAPEAVRKDPAVHHLFVGAKHA